MLKGIAVSIFDIQAVHVDVLYSDESGSSSDDVFRMTYPYQVSERVRIRDFTYRLD